MGIKSFQMPVAGVRQLTPLVGKCHSKGIMRSELPDSFARNAMINCKKAWQEKLVFMIVIERC
jgi:hypothetical protein